LSIILDPPTLAGSRALSLSLSPKSALHRNCGSCPMGALARTHSRDATRIPGSGATLDHSAYGRTPLAPPDVREQDRCSLA